MQYKFSNRKKERDLAMESSDETKFRKLKNFNLAMGFLHLVQGLLILALSSSYALPVQTNFLAYDEVTKEMYHVTDTIVEIPLGPMIAMFLFVSAVAHFSLSTYAYPWYVRNLKKGINYSRWYE